MKVGVRPGAKRMHHLEHGRPPRQPHRHVIFDKFLDEPGGEGSEASQHLSVAERLPRQHAHSPQPQPLLQGLLQIGATPDRVMDANLHHFLLARFGEKPGNH